ncbi:rho GTPase-activating protein 27 isoform X3 [Betta splendens]|uniref:Rho GTPase-activating protein 27 isoform X3 n=1 Tax=Betta splendens TaxID=158456 RepID=A0A6P7L653_BETSP|nr:rho GTPase-activating protein 27 isoform X3 [Betta splendens]
MELVLVQYEFEYKAKDGHTVSIKPNERYILVSKTNEHWWHVRRDLHTKPFYVPAQYMKEAPAASGPEDEAETTQASAQDASRQTYRFSTFGLCDDRPDIKLWEAPKKAQNHNSVEPLKTSGDQLYSRPLHVPKVRNGPKRPRSLLLAVKAEEPQAAVVTTVDDSLVFSSPPNPVYDTIPEITVTDLDSFPAPPSPAAFCGLSASQQEDLVPSARASSTDTLSPELEENENIRSAVYVNVAQLRQSISESPPSAPSSYSPSYLDPEGWEVHVDRDSGQEYYHHPPTGRTTWDNPFLDPSPSQSPCFPSPPPSPAYSLPPPSPPAWPSDWEQLVDETSGRPYYHNTMSGETSWEPPEQQSPYPPSMEPMSVHRFLEDAAPPLPEEDYPQVDYPAVSPPEAYSEVRATGPPTLPKEFAHGQNWPGIPRANLDRSNSTGWNLNVEPNGTWVFSSEHCSDQWIKSADERGKTFYYLKDGSKSQWSLPEAPAAACGASRVENGDVDNASVIKNWRHTMGPSQFSAPQDDMRFVPTHRRNTSDYSSDSSSTGNSPETQQNLQNLEKAGILNKTKVSENGKKVRKNWTQTWTVLHGGVLTFHKDPKSAATGASNKTNQIVPEVMVELRGAVIGWASKDKSSKKNVLELKSKNGTEFLIQYDTESIINDWYKILTDTIRQLEYKEHHSDEDDADLYEKIPNVERDDKPAVAVEKRRREPKENSSKPAPTPSTSSIGDTDQKKVRTKLMKFLMKRPTLQSVKEKGYIRENVFGCHLATLCAHERTTVPSFVEKCTKAVERRGLDIDGLYRVNGNLAVIQKLRFKADHGKVYFTHSADKQMLPLCRPRRPLLCVKALRLLCVLTEELDLEDGQWEDVHVITGALKLFFRELPEPLFPFSHFNDFITAIRISDYKTKLSCISDLVESLPPANHDTMKLIFGHLCRVIQYGEDNRMTVQNVAIVFGPTLLRPEMESSNIAMHMVFQNQIVEFILNEYKSIFHPS